MCRENILRQLEPKRFVSQKKKISGNKPFITWRNLAIVSLLGGGFLYWVKLIKDEKDQRMYLSHSF